MLSTVSIMPGMENLRPGPHTDQQRVVPIAQLAAEPVFQLPQRDGDLDPQLGRFRPWREVLPAGLGGDGETGGTGRPSLVISARFAPLPPSRSFWSLSPSEKS